MVYQNASIDTRPVRGSGRVIRAAALAVMDTVAYGAAAACVVGIFIGLVPSTFVGVAVGLVASHLVSVDGGRRGHPTVADRFAVVSVALFVSALVLGLSSVVLGEISKQVVVAVTGIAQVAGYSACRAAFASVGGSRTFATRG